MSDVGIWECWGREKEKGEVVCDDCLGRREVVTVSTGKVHIGM